MSILYFHSLPGLDRLVRHAIPRTHEVALEFLIVSPRENISMKSGALHVQGVAWAGEADIAKVEVSTDSGATWQSTQFGKEQSHYAWRLWRYSWNPSKPGAYTIMSQGRMQPDSVQWNPSGYLINVVDRVQIHVQT